MVSATLPTGMSVPKGLESHTKERKVTRITDIAKKENNSMTDKVQKIREAVENRYEYWKEKESNSHSIESEIRMSECQHLLLMLDSLQEEPVNRTTADIEYAMQEVEEKSKAFTKAHKKEGSDEILAQMRGEEPVSEDLEKAAFDYAEACKYDGGEKLLCVEHFRAGAQWQKEYGEFAR